MKGLTWHDYINLPQLDIKGQNWTPEGQILKMLEELGEVSQALNKDHDPKKTAAETFDFIMTGVTLLNMLEAKGVDVNQQFIYFMDKLKRKNYLLNVCNDNKKVIPVIRDMVKIYEGRDGCGRR